VAPEPDTAPPAEEPEPAEVPVEVPAPPRRRGPWWAKALIIGGTALVVLATGSAVGLRLLVDRYDHAVHKAVLLDPGVRVSPTSNGGGLDLGVSPVSGPLNFLLLGSDARDTDPGNARSDSIILVHVPASMDRAYLISIPRDLRVQIPADQAHGYSGGYEKINGAFNHGGGGITGFQLLSKTLNQLIGVKFDGAGIIDFSGFQAVVNLLGGVDMYVDEETRSIHTGTVYHVGYQHLRPWQALDYVRQRELLPDGDYDRQRHQQQFLKAVLQEAMSQGIATNPIKLDQLIRAVGSSLTVDTNGVSTADLVLALRDVKPAGLVGIKVPSAPTMIGGISYVVADPLASGLYQAIVSDTLDAWVAANPSWVNPI
jgi:LCP family protein required for cell wall assembly